MKYSLRAVKGAELARIHFDADNDGEARRNSRRVYDECAPSDEELWNEGKVATVAEDGTIIYKFTHCDTCNKIVCADGCGDYDDR